MLNIIKKLDRLNEDVSNVDSQGNELSKEQMDYFKNSKIRDKQGRLLVCYHGTSNPGFLEFNPKDSKSQFGGYKFKNVNANYFTTGFENAKGYTELGVGSDFDPANTPSDRHSNNIYSCYLNIVNPYIVDNKSEADMKSWLNIKDEKVREKQLARFEQVYNKWCNEYITEDDLDEINKDFAPFNVEFRPSEDYEDNYDLYTLGNNGAFGGEHSLMSWYSFDDYFDKYDLDMKKELRDNIVGDLDEYPDDYNFTLDEIVKWVIYMNEVEGTNYDGIICYDILDTGPKGNLFTGSATDIVTLKSSNQIKLIKNLTPTNSTRINESSNDTYYLPDNLENAINMYIKYGYEPTIVSLDKLAKDNNLMDDDDLGSYHQKLWNTTPDKYQIDSTKASQWRNSELPFAVQHKNGKIEIGDGRHRCRALINQGYKYIEIPLLVE